MVKKKVCLDLRCLQIGHENRGIGMHVRSILENITDTESVDFYFYAFDKNDPIKELGISVNFPYTLIQTPTVKMSIDDPRDLLRLLRVIWHSYKPLRSSGIDEFIQFDFTLGSPRWIGTRVTMIAYDLIPLIMRSVYIPGVWQTFQSNTGLARFKRSLRAAYYKWRYSLHYREFGKADKIISISEDTRQSLIERLHIPAEKITTIPLAPVFESGLQPDDTILAKVEKPYLFYIGATDARKRVQDLVAAFNIIRGRGHDISLVLAGGEFKAASKIPSEAIREAVLNSSYKSDIYCLGFVSDAEKLALYRHAAAFVFPTAYEGFGLPVLEGMQQSCPVISYRNSSIPEVADDAALLVPTGDILGLVHAAEKVLADEKLRTELKKRGRQQASLFTWEGHVEVFMKVITT